MTDGDDNITYRITQFNFDVSTRNSYLNESSKNLNSTLRAYSNSFNSASKQVK